MKSQTTPEGGTVTYTYTPFDAVDTRTDARGVVTDYDYNDGLNRLTSVSYNTSGAPGVEATSPVSITYKTSAPGNGQVQQVSDSAGSETYGYDSLGRNTSKSRVFTGNANTYTTQYEYNAVGQQTAIIYPSNKRVRTNYDSRGRFAGLDKMNGSLVDLTYLSQVSYRVSGQIASLKLANQKMSETYSYSDTRLQLTGQAVTNNQSQQTMMSLTYNYQASAGASGANTTAGNSGQLMGVTASINGQGRNQAFTYDNVGRLKTAAGWNSTTNRRFDYDRWGNRTGVWDTNAPSGGNQIQTVTLKEQSAGVPNNRINTVNAVSYFYDNGGNLTNDGGHSYQYDAENRMVKVDNGASGSYVYDAANRRVKRTTALGTIYYIWEGGAVIAEYATVSQGGASGIRYYHPDRLSTRMITDSESTGSGGMVVGTEDHLPFGEDAGVVGESEKHRFTNYERDAESGTDYAVNRQYANITGRFMRPDPLGGSIGSPQSLNRYSYSLNDPVNLFDPIGLYYCPPQFGSCTELTVNINGVGFVRVMIGLDGLGGGTFLWDRTTGPYSFVGKLEIAGLKISDLPQEVTWNILKVEFDWEKSERSKQGELRECGKFKIKVTLGNVKKGTSDFGISDVKPVNYNENGIRYAGEQKTEWKGDKVTVTGIFQLGNIVYGGATGNIGIKFTLTATSSGASSEALRLGVDTTRGIQQGHVDKDGRIAKYLEVRDTISGTHIEAFKPCP